MKTDKTASNETKNAKYRNRGDLPGRRSLLQLPQLAAAPYCRVAQRGQINSRGPPGDTTQTRFAWVLARPVNDTNVNRTPQIRKFRHHRYTQRAQSV